MFTRMTPEELERRRLASIEAWEHHKEAEWEAHYQEICDKLYWHKGRCCAGCDHWSSHGGLTGQCNSAPMVSGHDVMKSMGIDRSSYPFPPGQPWTQAEHVCGAFKDDFDWSSLPEEYLRRIGANPAA